MNAPNATASSTARRCVPTVIVTVSTRSASTACAMRSMTCSMLLTSRPTASCGEAGGGKGQSEAGAE
eukprot:363547-Chlamydomonas_euryale.AAC.15